ncbi:MAG: nuclear transport factor 2 family protein [Taibaiella sp.]|jgi:hypothetical protein
MKLPSIISELLLATANFDSEKYADCFSQTAVVLDEGETYSGRDAIRKWNDVTNEKYSAKLEPVAYVADGDTGIMTTKVSGNFDGSPIILKYHFVFNGEKIGHLKITG